MEGFTIIDGVVALVIVLSALLAYSRGFVRESLAIAGWIVAGIALAAHPLVGGNLFSTATAQVATPATSTAAPGLLMTAFWLLVFAALILFFRPWSSLEWR